MQLRISRVSVTTGRKVKRTVVRQAPVCKRKAPMRVVPHVSSFDEASAIDEDAAYAFMGGEDFYTILGVVPAASSKEIKKAYYALMRDFHPDLYVTEDSTDLCVLLNEIYETLMDPDKRALYDTLSGFSLNSVNPFKDRSYEPDQAFVDEVNCIGCGKCVRACPASFYIEPSKYGRARVVAQGASSIEEIEIAMETCPVDCIHWVTSPQLSLLETALSTMNRVEVWIMQRSGRSPGNVFYEASRAWERRMSNILAAAEIRKHQQAASAAAKTAAATTGWSFWGSGSPTGSGASMDDDTSKNTSSNNTASGRQIAGLAAAAARTARLWRSYHKNKPAKGLLHESL